MEFVKINKRKYKVYDKVIYYLFGIKIWEGLKNVGFLKREINKKEFRFYPNFSFSFENKDLYEITFKIEELNSLYNAKIIKKLKGK